MRDVERNVILYVVDSKWKEHLFEMDYLRQGIGMRSMAQKNPLVEYESEGYLLFNTLMDEIVKDTVRILFTVKKVEDTPHEEAPDLSNLVYSAPSEPGSSSDIPVATDIIAEPEVTTASLLLPTNTSFDNQDLNALCACGSGKKYKRCHGAALNN
jgi:preprotein translocase subunit SecA